MGAGFCGEPRIRVWGGLLIYNICFLINISLWSRGAGSGCGYVIILLHDGRKGSFHIGWLLRGIGWGWGNGQHPPRGIGISLWQLVITGWVRYQCCRCRCRRRLGLSGCWGDCCGWACGCLRACNCYSERGSSRRVCGLGSDICRTWKANILFSNVVSCFNIGFLNYMGNFFYFFMSALM